MNKFQGWPTISAMSTSGSLVSSERSTPVTFTCCMKTEKDLAHTAGHRCSGIMPSQNSSMWDLQHGRPDLAKMSLPSNRTSPKLSPKWTQWCSSANVCFTDNTEHVSDSLTEEAPVQVMTLIQVTSYTSVPLDGGCGAKPTEMVPTDEQSEEKQCERCKVHSHTPKKAIHSEKGKQSTPKSLENIRWSGESKCRHLGVKPTNTHCNLHKATTLLANTPDKETNSSGPNELVITEITENALTDTPVCTHKKVTCESDVTLLEDYTDTRHEDPRKDLTIHMCKTHDVSESFGPEEVCLHPEVHSKIQENHQKNMPISQLESWDKTNVKSGPHPEYHGHETTIEQRAVRVCGKESA